MLEQLKENPGDLDLASRIINSMAKKDTLEISYTNHGNERKQERQVNVITIQQALKDGAVVEHRKSKYGKDVYKVQLKDRYGDINVVTLIVNINKLHIITVTRKDRW